MNTAIYSQFGDLGKSQSEIKQTRKKNNILEFYYYGPIFANFKGYKGSVKWFPYNDAQSIGIGYDSYEAGWLRIKKI